MRKYLYSLAALAGLMGLASCDNDQEKPFLDSSIGRNPIIASNYNSSFSRAIDVNNSNLEGFDLVGYLSEGVYEGGSLGETYIPVSGWSKTADGNFAPSVPSYWVKEGMFNFFAWNMTDATSVETTSEGIPVLGFTSDGSRDLVTATCMDEPSSLGRTDPFSLKFTHALTKILFSTSSAPHRTFWYRINSIRLKAKPCGTYTLATRNGDPGTWDVADLVWEYQYGQQLYPDCVCDGVKSDAGTIALNGDDGTGLNLIPQTGKVQILVDYILYSDAEETHVISECHKTVDLLCDWLPGKAYRYTLLIDADNDVNEISCTLSMEDWSEPVEEKGRYYMDGHEYVDLGLPSGTLWSTCNIGASAPEQYGEYYQWAGLTAWDENCCWMLPRDTDDGFRYNFKENVAPYFDSSARAYTKYTSADQKKSIEPCDDAARQQWGEHWQIPTHTQVFELRQNTTMQWLTDYLGTGVAGVLLVSDINGASIFLPAAGRHELELVEEGYSCDYWSNHIGGFETDIHDSLGIEYYANEDQEPRNNVMHRCVGLPIRPVVSKS